MLKEPTGPFEITNFKLPKHMSMSLEHNPHADTYETVADHFAGEWECTDVWDEAWISPEDMQRAIETNELWTLHIYPRTPVGFNFYAASTLEGVLEMAWRDLGGEG